MLSNKTLNPIVTELFIRGRKLIISLVFQNLILLCLFIFFLYYTKLYALFHYENSRNTRTSTNCI